MTEAMWRMQHENMLREALVGPNVKTYQTSATFRQTIDSLILILPDMIQGLAAKAIETDAELITLFDRLSKRELWTEPLLPEEASQ